MALVRGGIQIRTIYHLHKISTRKFHYRRWFPTVDLHSQKKETIPYPRCGFGACLRCGEHLKYSDYRADGIGDSFFFRLSNQARLQLKSCQ